MRYKLQVLSSKVWFTVGIFPERDNAVRTRDNIELFAMIKLPMRIKLES